MSELAVRDNTHTTDLTITDGQTTWTDKQKAALVQLGVKETVSNADLAVFFHHSARTGLDPFARQIYMIERWTKDGPRQTIQTGIDGFRLIARRATDARNGTFGYLPTEWCGRDGLWRDVWLDNTPPAAAKVTVVRDGAHFPAVALFTEYAQTNKQGQPTQMWATKGALMLAKCAEALALRKAFPQDLSGLYTGDEMAQADNTRPAQMEQVSGPPMSRPASAAEPMNEDQRKKLHALVNELGLTRDQKIAGASKVIRRPIESTSDLSKDEASQVIDSLQARANELAAAHPDDPGEDEVVDAEVVEDSLPIDEPT